MTKVKAIIKTVLSYIYNPYSMIRIVRGKRCSIGKGLQVIKPSAVRLGNEVQIGRMGRLACYGDGEIVIEDGCYICHFFSALASDKLVIKKNTLIASYVAVIGENHSLDPESGLLYGQQPLIGKPVTIGANCWIGEKVVILPGITIGDWCVIGACSLVNQDIPSYSIAVGNPARVIKKYDFELHSWVKLAK